MRAAPHLCQRGRAWSTQREQSLRYSLASALFQKLRLASELGRQTEAGVFYADIVARFRNVSDPVAALVLKETKALRTGARQDAKRLSRMSPAGAAQSLVFGDKLANLTARSALQFSRKLGYIIPANPGKVIEYWKGIVPTPDPQGQTAENNTVGQTEGYVSNDQRNISPEQKLVDFFRARHVPEGQMAEAIAEAERIVLKAKIKSCPVWDERPNELRYLTAPGYLRYTYSFLFDKDGRLTHEDLLREHDAKLIQLVQQYIAQTTMAITCAGTRRSPASRLR
jgi:hypothetical protein